MILNDRYKKLLIFCLLLLAGIYFLYLVRGILFPFIIAGIIAYLINPIIEKMLERGINRIGAIIILFSMLLMVSLMFLIFGLPLIMEEINALSKTLPTYVNTMQAHIDELYKDLQRIKLPAMVKQVADQTLQKAEQVGLDFLNRITDLILSTLSQMFNLIMAPIIAFYLLKDKETLSENLDVWIPNKYDDDVYQLGSEINQVLSGFMRGQFLVAIFIAIISTIGLFFLKVKFAIVLGVIAGAFNVIPYVGPILGAIPAVAIVLVREPIKSVGVIILFTVIQQIEGGIISPRIVGEKVGLHPITVIFSILAGGHFGGILGMIFAVPIAGVVKVFLKFIYFKFLE